MKKTFILACVALLVSITSFAIGPITGTTFLCTGYTVALTDITPGGVWTSTNTSVAVIGSGTGVVSGLTAGTTLISYTLGGSFDTVTVRVYPTPGVITGGGTVCVGSTIGLSDIVTGGTWSNSCTTIATVGLTTGFVTGVSGGGCTITYTTTGGCTALATVTVNPKIFPTVSISASPGDTVCPGTTVTYTTTITSGGFAPAYEWDVNGVPVPGATASTFSFVPSNGNLVGVVLMSSLPCALVGIDSALMIIDSPTVTATASHATCGDQYTLTAIGGLTYSWAPASRMSCPTCGTTTISPAATTTYTVTGTDAHGCTGTDTISLYGNRIFGHITFGGPTPDTLDMKVWLIQYNPIDSSIKALDSMNTCYVDSITYYEFDGEAPGNYMVKARMIYGAPGTSGYIPTYSSSTPNWSSAATVAHTTASDSLHVIMIYGTMPSGPGFISGNVYFGAGKGTGGVEADAGMLMYLEDAATHKVLSYTYTDDSGAYFFSRIPNGSYIIYPEDYQYLTTPSSAINLNSSGELVGGINFKRHISPIFQITPYIVENTLVGSLTADNGITIFPNPTSGELNIRWNGQQVGAANVTITDVTGQRVFASDLNMTAASGQAQINTTKLIDGMYFIFVKSANVNYSSKLLIQK